MLKMNKLDKKVVHKDTKLSVIINNCQDNELPHLNYH